MLTVCLLWAPAAFAQPIHTQFQKAAYANPSEWPFLSGQCHWAPAESVNPQGSLTPFLGHTHDGEGNWPIFAELSAPVTVHVAFVLFHTDGHIGEIWGPLVSSIIWDETGTSTAPPLTGNPNSVETHFANVTFDVTRRTLAGGYDPPPLRGWYALTLNTRTHYANGNALDNLLSVPYYSILDPSAPEAPISDGLGRIRAACFPVTKDPAGPSAFGTNITDIQTYAPILAPINSPWPVSVFAYGYGIPKGIPAGRYEVHLDPNPHAGIAGKTLRTITAGSVEDITVLDPAALGLGTHKLAFDWIQSGDGAPNLFLPGETLVSRLVFNVTVVDPSTPEPQPPVGLPPATPPAPSTTPTSSVLTWQALGSSNLVVRIEREVDQSGAATGKFRVCVGTECTEVK